jgi:quercetin dioxygenase-like cupin family protein
MVLVLRSTNRREWPATIPFNIKMEPVQMQRKFQIKQRTLTYLSIAAAALALGAGAFAQGTGFKRTPLQRSDDPGSQAYEVIQGQADIDPGGSSGMHYHHGIEMGYIVSGEIQLERAGKPTATIKAGEAFLIDPTVHHNATNKSPSPARVLATYVVEKGKPLAENVK